MTTLRDAYRVGQFASKRLAGATSPRAEAPAPLLTLELPQRTALLRRIRAYVVACIFDAAMPLGMARLIAGAPRRGARARAAPRPGRSRRRRRRPAWSCPCRARRRRARWRAPPPDDSPPHTLTFGIGAAPALAPAAAPLRARPREPTAAPTSRRTRPSRTWSATAWPCAPASRLAALERPEALGPEAIVLIETAVQDILGIDRAELRRIA